METTQIIALEDIGGKTMDSFMAEVRERFAAGVGRIEVTQGEKLVGRFISPAEAQRQMARQIAEQWLTNKDAMDRLAKSLDQQPEPWK